MSERSAVPRISRSAGLVGRVERQRAEAGHRRAAGEEVQLLGGERDHVKRKLSAAATNRGA